MGKPRLSKDQRRKKKVAGRKSGRTKDHYIYGKLNGSAPIDWYKGLEKGLFHA